MKIFFNIMGLVLLGLSFFFGSHSLYSYIEHGLGWQVGCDIALMITTGWFPLHYMFFQRPNDHSDNELDEIDSLDLDPDMDYFDDGQPFYEGPFYEDVAHMSREQLKIHIRKLLKHD